jgi:hypothetical protein
VLVTGATGGVGAIAVMLLARAGHEVEAATGSPVTIPEVERCSPGSVPRGPCRARRSPAPPGVRSDRHAGPGSSTSPVGRRSPARSRRRGRGGVVAACGLADDTALATTVMPFIVRGVTLAGIDSVLHPMPARPAVWDASTTRSTPTLLARVTTTVGLADVPARAAHAARARRPRTHRRRHARLTHPTEGRHAVLDEDGPPRTRASCCAPRSARSRRQGALDARRVDDERRRRDPRLRADRLGADRRARQRRAVHPAAAAHPMERARADRSDRFVQVIIGTAITALGSLLLTYWALTVGFTVSATRS